MWTPPLPRTAEGGSFLPLRLLQFLFFLLPFQLELLLLGCLVADPRVLARELLAQCVTVLRDLVRQRAELRLLAGGQRLHDECPREVAVGVKRRGREGREAIRKQCTGHPF